MIYGDTGKFAKSAADTPRGSFSPSEAIRQQVLCAMRSKPGIGRNNYGILFYGPFAQDPDTYGIGAQELVFLQQQALMVTALAEWDSLESGKWSLYKAINAAHLAYTLRGVPKQKPPFHFSDRDLDYMGIEPAQFDRLVRVLHLHCIHVAQSRDVDHEETDFWLPGVKTFLGFPVDQPVDYAAALAAMGYTPSDNGRIQPIREIINAIAFHPVPEHTRDAVTGASDLLLPLEHGMPGFYKSIEGKALTQFDPVDRQPKDPQPMQFDGTPFIKQPVAVSFANMHANPCLESAVVETVFDGDMWLGFRAAESLYDLYLIAQVDHGRFGFRPDDMKKLQDLSAFATVMDLLRTMDANDPDAFMLLTQWVRQSPLSPDVMDELGIPRNHADTFIRAYGYRLLELEQAALIDGYGMTVDAHLLYNALITPATSDDDVRDNVANNPKYVRRNEQKLLRFNFAQTYRNFGLDPAHPVESISHHFDHLPDQSAPIKAWYPDMYARICRKNTCRPIYPTVQRDDPENGAVPSVI